MTIEKVREILTHMALPPEGKGENNYLEGFFECKKIMALQAKSALEHLPDPASDEVAECMCYPPAFCTCKAAQPAPAVVSYDKLHEVVKLAYNDHENEPWVFPIDKISQAVAKLFGLRIIPDKITADERGEG